MMSRLDAILEDHAHLHEALSSKHCDVVCRHIDDPNKLCSTDGVENCFVLIAKFGNYESMRHLLDIKPSAIHCLGPQGQTLLMYATKDIFMMKTLLQFQPDVNARNDKGENVLMHRIREIDQLECEMFSKTYYTLNLMVRYILDEEIKIDATDVLGKTAVDCVLDLEIVKNCEHLPTQIHILLRDLLVVAVKSTKLAPQLIIELAKKAFNFDIFELIVYLLNQGVDPKVRDNDGNDIMSHVIASYYEHVDSSAPKLYYRERISQNCLELLRSGCELKGMDHIFVRRQTFAFKIGCDCVAEKVATTVNVLAVLLRHCPFHDFFKELPKHNLNLKKNKRRVSELTYFLLGHKKWCGIYYRDFEMVDTTVTHLLACGVNVVQQLPGSRQLLDNDADDLEKEIVDTLPDSLWLAENTRKVYHISCKILLTLLRFWKYPPLSLFNFIYHDSLHAFSVRTMLKFLARVGCKLPPSSPLFKCLERKLNVYADKNPGVGDLPRLFKQLHVRATLNKVTTSGLDLSSLRVLCQGELREIPREIADYLNFMEHPGFCEDDLMHD
ncbi:hypothetical protein B566_EDAN014287 [Ephemera danica]|nr:hypothetical protein B566_EDAN014287 [Ephemera danica]